MSEVNHHLNVSYTTMLLFIKYDIAYKLPNIKFDVAYKL